MYPKLIYSEIPKEYLFCKTTESSEDRPNAYAWISLSYDQFDKIQYVIEAWIYAESEIIEVLEFQKPWFLQELKDLLEDKFVSNCQLAYLIEFNWEKGDRSVGIWDGYNCSLVYNSKGEPVTRTWIWSNE